MVAPIDAGCPLSRWFCRIQLLLLFAAWPVCSWASPRWPVVDSLPAVEGLPDLLRFEDGKRVTSRNDWLRRRAEILQLVQYYEYGHLPPGPGNVVAESISSVPVLDGTAIEKRLLLSMGPGHQIRVHVRMLVPQPRRLPAGPGSLARIRRAARQSRGVVIRSS